MDSDHDGLDDNWELANFGSLAQGPADDPNGNGYSNMREYLMGTDPRAVTPEFKVVPGPFDSSHVRLTWSGPTNATYEIFSGANPAVTLSLSTNIPSGFPETEFIAPTAGSSTGFFRVRRKTVQPNAGLSSGNPADP